jgi:single-stranded-DNA-specific exonuclease
VVEIDLLVSFDMLTSKFIGILKQMAPFGPENQRPVFEAREVSVLNSLSSFKERHVRFLAAQDGNDAFFPVVGFEQIEHYERLKNKERFRMAFTIEENTYNGETSLQLRVKDINFAAA